MFDPSAADTETVERMKTLPLGDIDQLMAEIGKYDVSFVGYSLPFIEGEPIKISDDPELDAMADILSIDHGIYTGNRGDEFNHTKNAIIHPETGRKVFIDVCIHNR